MKTNKFITVILFLIVLLTGCSQQEVFVNEDNEINKITIEELKNDTKKCFVIVGEKDDKYTNSLSNHLENAVKIENEKIYLLYANESQEEIKSFFSPNKLPMLYVVEDNKVINSIEYYDKDDVAEMDSPSEVKFATDVRDKITKFVNDNKN